MKSLHRFSIIFSILLTLSMMLSSVSSVSADGVVDNAYVTIRGLPAKASNVLMVHPGFTNTIGDGSRGFLAEPGGGVMGDCDVAIKKRTGGYMDCATTANSTQFTEDRGDGRTPRNTFDVPEGGFLFTSFQDGNVWLYRKSGGMIDLNIKQIDGNPGPNNTLMIVRGDFADGKKSDRNHNGEFEGLIAGHNWLAQIRTPKAGSSVAFVSEGWFQQQLDTSFGGGTNCGDAGCPLTIVIYVDLNTGACGVWKLTSPKVWETVYKNYDS